MKGIVSSVKRRVFGKDGEELIGIENLGGQADVNHGQLSSTASSNATTGQVKGQSNETALSRQENSDPSNNQSQPGRRDRLRSRGTSNPDIKFLSKNDHSKSKKDEENAKKGPSSPQNKDSETRKKLRKNKKEFSNQSASFNPNLCNVPFEHNSLKPGLLPGSSPDADPSIFGTLEALRDVSSQSEREQLLRKKVIACGAVLFDMEHPDWSTEKDAKADTLHELLDYIVNTKQPVSESLIPDILHMVGVNLFRDLPTQQDYFILHHFQTDDDEQHSDPQWVHRSIVYEFFVHFILTTENEIKILRQYLTQSFVLKLLDLFQTEDPREREYLKSILHRIYGKVMSLRLFIRKAVQNVFHRFIEGQGRPYGISELLEILGSIINGFATPLKTEHKLMLEKSFVPLHKSWAYPLFQSQLQYCMIQYILKEPMLAEVIVNGILRYWPTANTQKELCFINELEEIVSEVHTQRQIFDNIKVPLFTRLAQSMQSSHFQVAERVLFLWHPNCHISTIVDEHRDEIVPILTGSLYTNSVTHWNGVVHQLTYQVSKMMTEKDEKYFARCNAETEAKLSAASRLDEQREACWQMLKKASETAG